jgi:hypothetical protein
MSKERKPGLKAYFDLDLQSNRYNDAIKCDKHYFESGSNDRGHGGRTCPTSLLIWEPAGL